MAEDDSGSAGLQSGSQQSRLDAMDRARKLFNTQRAEAVRIAREALEAARSEKDQRVEAEALLLIADADRIEGRTDSAFELGVQAAQCAKAAGVKKCEHTACNLLGAVAWQRGDFDLAIEWFGQALRLGEELGSEERVSAACNNLGLAHYTRGDLARALEFHQRSLEIRERIRDPFVFESHLNLGLLYVDLGDWDKALESYYRALAELEKAGDAVNLSLCYNNIGDVYLKRGKLDRAQFHLEQAATIAEAAQAVFAQAEALGNLGEVAFAAGDYAKAHELYDRDLAVSAQSEQHEEMAETLRRWAELELAQGELAGCKTKLARALELCTKSGSRREEGNVRRVMGELALVQSEDRPARSALEQSVAILRSLGENYELGRSLLELGRVLGKSGDNGQKQLDEARTIFLSLGAMTLADEAEKMLTPAVAEPEEPDLLQYLTELACRDLSLDQFCARAARLLVEGLPVAWAQLVLRDGQEFSFGATDSLAAQSLRLALEAGGRRVGTLLLPGAVELGRVRTLGHVLGLAISQALSRPVLPVVPVPSGRRFPGIIGADTTLSGVIDTVERVAPTGATVLLLGESGTGKEVIARTLHELSDRKGRPFVAVNCAAIPETLLESELFGIEKSTATGVAARQGKFEAAGTGTIFLDEIGDMSPGLQAKMLRVLQERAFERVGGRQPIRTDVRVIAATNRDLQKAIEQGQFRPDLYYRLNVIAIPLPPLRERKQDIPELTNHFISRFSKEYSKPVKGVTQESLACLLNHTWPGNVRELQNVVERGVILARGELISADELPADLQRAAEGAPAPQAAKRQVADELKKKALTEALAQSDWVVKRAAEKLGISRVRLHQLIKKYDIKHPDSD